MKRNISSQMVLQTLLLSSLQQLLEMSAFCLYTRLKKLMPLVNCIVTDAVVHSMPNVLQMFLQLVRAVQL